MRQYEVFISVHNEYAYTVEASSEAEAQAIAMGMRARDIANYGDDSFVSVEVIAADDIDEPIQFLPTDQAYALLGKGCDCGCERSPY